MKTRPQFIPHCSRNNTGNDTEILWADINTELEQNKHLDEDELLELRQHLEQQKRQALLKDILRSPNYLKEVSNDKLEQEIEPDNNQCLDNVGKYDLL